MSLQVMPVIDRMNEGAIYHRFTDENAWEQVQITPAMSTFLNGHKRVKLTDDQRISGRPGGVWDVRKCFGQLRLPYPAMWIEWRDLAGVDKGMPVTDMAISCLESRLATPFLGLPEDDKRLHKNGWVALPWTYFNGVLRALPGMLIVDLDDDGQMLGMRGSVASVNEEYRYQTGEQRTATIVDLIWEGLVAVGWMNCRNVSLEEHRALTFKPKTLDRKKRQNRTSSVVYHTIKLPSGSSSSAATSRRGEQVSKRVHTVRGHFKTFTAEAPLMGRHTGTYWWGWQLRGNKETGEVVSDYRVGAS